jgi:hypothetical protein
VYDFVLETRQAQKMENARQKKKEKLPSFVMAVNEHYNLANEFFKVAFFRMQKLN